MADIATKARRPLSFFIFAALVLATIAAVVFGIVTQQQRVDALATALASKNQIIEAKDDQLASIFDKYTALADDCEQAADCETTTPSPEVIQQYIEGTPGLPGATGEPGRPPTSAEVSEAVRGYCAVRGDCRGADGAAGANGADGAPGRDGADGANGADGRSVTNNQCVGEGDASYWETTYSDGSTTTSPGPCRIASLLP